MENEKTISKDIKKKRNSSIEILRIIAMLFIIAHHAVYYRFNANLNTNTYTNIIKYFFLLGGILGVNIFVMISSYFMCDSNINLKKIAKVLIKTWVYSVVIMLIYVNFIDTKNELNLNQIKMVIFPFTFNQYWFITDYIILMVFSPYLNELINNLSKEKYLKLIVTLLVLVILMSDNVVKRSLPSLYSTAIWFTTLYLIIGYIKKHRDLSKVNKNVNLLIAVISYAILIAKIMLVRTDNKALVEMLSNGLRFNNIYVFIASLNLFIYFIKLPEKNIKIINIIGPATFGVYLIHNNFLIKGHMWNLIGKIKIIDICKYPLTFILFATVCIFVSFVVIDLIMQFFLDKTILKISSELCEKGELKIVKKEQN